MYVMESLGDVVSFLAVVLDLRDNIAAEVCERNDVWDCTTHPEMNASGQSVWVK